MVKCLVSEPNTYVFTVASGSSHDMLSFNADIQVIFGTVYSGRNPFIPDILLLKAVFSLSNHKLAHNSFLLPFTGTFNIKRGIFNGRNYVNLL